ncbi:hybrid sensor histidine kinase/response regulator [Mesonia maritima]|uniref:histidine kinase n=1 Tax=Mesonia maritima TaxID=1793873 RepID=A0ABU1K1N1_9FLAO|nr:response regulator [Mesonia maritima]MDR6299531.1 hypothetical protein [Mesonia maritima]
MKSTKQSITFKVLTGYILLSAIAVLTVWFVYNKIINLSEANTIGNENNKRLLLVSEAVTNLYVAEGISRNIIQNERSEDLSKFNAQLDTISFIVDSLKHTYSNDEIIPELDSINELLNLKKQNLIDLLALRKQNSTNNYYDRVLTELEKTNYLFEDDNYNERLKEYKPYIRKVLVKYLEYAKEDNANTLTQQSADSLINSMKTVLTRLETEERLYQQNVINKENALLENDRNLSAQLRNLRAEIEQEEVQKSVSQVAKSRAIIEDTSNLIIVLGIACMLIILLFVVLVLKDTNRSQRYRTELEKAKLYAETLLKQREQFTATITHDLRTPLNTISGYSDLLTKTELTEKQAHYLDQLKKSSVYILHLVNDLLDFSKLEAGKMAIEKLPFNPKNVIYESINGVIPSEDNKELELKITIAEDLDQNFLSDPFRIQQILTNLIGNAYKFTSQGFLKIEASLENLPIKNKLPQNTSKNSPTTKEYANINTKHTTFKSGSSSKIPQVKPQDVKPFGGANKTLKISIEDSGIGITPKQQKIIFDEFSQAKSSIEKQYGGSGLGLAITKRLVLLLNGKIYLESEVEKGSKFTVEIPIENAKQTFSTQTKHFHLKNGKNKTILIVEDEPAQLALTTEILKQNQLSFETATNGKEALKKLKKQRFDLILSDIQMPEMNGFQFIRKLKANPKTNKIPVIALSGRKEINQEIYTEKGFETNLIKPFHTNELLQVIAEILKLTIEEQNPTTSTANATTQIYSVEDLKIFTGEDETALNLIITTFIENTTTNVADLQKAVNEENNPQIAFLAHKMLPMLRQLKANNVVKYLADLEQQNELNLSSNEVRKRTQQALKNIEVLLQKLKQDFKV